MSTVYVIQKQQRFCHEAKELVDRFDLSTAEQHGEIKYLLSPQASPFNPESVIDELHDGLMNFGPDDFLLLVGNPVLIGLATAIAADTVESSINFLQWSGTEQRYICVKATNILK